MNSNEHAARIVLEHWRTAALAEEGAAWVILPHVLNLIESALDGEMDPMQLGVSNGADASALRDLARKSRS
jgi:hypothetical protein